MRIARSTFYYEPEEESLDELKVKADLKGEIEKIYLEFPGYGYRRVTKKLKRRGWMVNHKRVLKIMRKNDLLCRQRKRGVRTTNSDHSHPVFPDLIKDLVIKGINQAWVADITYIRILTAFVYLAVILDLHSRKVIGYSLSKDIDTGLTLTALRMAIKRREPSPGCIHHSDQGVQSNKSRKVSGVI